MSKKELEIEAAKLFAETSKIRVPKFGSLQYNNNNKQYLISFVAEARSAAGSAVSETISCIVEEDNLENSFCVSNPSSSSSSATTNVLTCPLTGLTARFSKSAKPTCLQTTLEIFRRENNHNNNDEEVSSSCCGIISSMLVSDLETKEHHGDVLNDAHLQSFCYDSKNDTAYFLIRRNTKASTRKTMEEFIVASASKKKEMMEEEGEEGEQSTRKAKSSSFASASWSDSLNTEYQAGEGYPDLNATEIVAVPRFTVPGELVKKAKRIFSEKFLEQNRFLAFPQVLSTTTTAAGGGVLVFASYVTDPIQYGLLHCFASRPTKVFALPLNNNNDNSSGDGDGDDFDNEPVEMDLSADVVKSLTVCPSQPNKFAYFSFPSELPMFQRPHLNCASLCVAELTADLLQEENETKKKKKKKSVVSLKSNKTVVGVVKKASNNIKDFPGFFPVFGQNDLVWLDSSTLLVTTVWRCALTIVAVKLSSSSSSAMIQPLTEIDFSVSRLHKAISCNNNNNNNKDFLLVAQYSATCTPPQMRVTKFNTETSFSSSSSSSSLSCTWKTIFDSSSSASVQNSNNNNNKKNEKKKNPTKNHSTEIKDFFGTHQCLFHKSSSSSSSSSSRRLLVTAHGGPNSMCASGFSRQNWLMLSAGFDILDVNYRGSLGFGRDNVETLLGQVGNMDIEDILTSVEPFLSKKEQEGGGGGETSFFFSGGSHSGFQACHLAGHRAPQGKKNEFSEKLLACAIRNPVTEISSMNSATDIGDWCQAQAGSSEVTKMRECSPMQHAENVRCDILLGIGNKDLRVPPFQGLSWARAVRNNSHRDKEVVVIQYPEDSHGLESPATEAEFAIQMLSFFLASEAKKKKKVK